MKCRIIIFGGTTEGRILSEYVMEKHIEVFVSVTTDYGARLLPDSRYIHVLHSKMDALEMERFFRKNDISIVIDATHPFAVEVTKNIKCASKNCHIIYYRVLREEKEVVGEEGIRYFENIEDIIQYLNEHEGGIFVAVGSKELKHIVCIRDAVERCILRVLDVEQIVGECEKMGFDRNKIIAKRGPFDFETNKRDFERYPCRYLVTKDSGSVGGFGAKCDAARALGMETLVLKRPREEGMGMEEMKKILMQEAADSNGMIKQNFSAISPSYSDSDRIDCESGRDTGSDDEKEIAIIGGGMGGYDTLTMEGKSALDRTEVIIGAKRLTDSVATVGKEILNSHHYDEVAEYIANTQKKYIVVLMSGDCGFYSGCTSLRKELSDREIKGVKIISGISSAVYLADRIQEVWQDMHFVSLHGVESNIVSEVKHHSKTFFLLGGKIDAAKLCQRLAEFYCGDYQVCIGEKLGSDSERILKGQAKEFVDIEAAPLSVILVYNQYPIQNAISGIRDEAFVRGQVPMTKAELRAVIMSKLNIEKSEICWDIGCGTGSVSVEMAGYAVSGRVYAIDKNAEAISLTEENCRRFGCDNVVAICEDIAKVTAEADTEKAAGGENREKKYARHDEPETPDKVFIGGGGGKLENIFAYLLQRNQRCRIVLTAVSLETLTDALKIYRKYGMEPEVTQIAVTRTKTAGKHKMFEALNPVFVMCGMRVLEEIDNSREKCEKYF